MAIATIRTTRAVDLALEAIRRAILEGEFESGSFLPSERSLAQSLGINRLTLRAALARLETEGLVRPEQGNGVRVLEYRSTAGLDLLTHLVSSDRGGLVRGFLELRRVIGAEAVALACERALEHHIKRLEELAELQAKETDLETFARRDLSFSRETVRASGNLAMELLLNTVAQLYESHPEIVSAMHHDIDEVRKSYGVVVALIRAGDAGLARRGVRQFLERLDAKTIERLEKGE